MSAHNISDTLATTTAPLQLIELDHQGILGIEGPDAVKFLQGQVTCDIRDLASPVSRAGAQCTPKGRMLSSFRVLQSQPETLLLRADASMLEAMQKDLGKYIVFSKARLSNRSEHYRLLGITGAGAAKYIEEISGQTFTGNDAWLKYRQSFFIQLDEQRIECWLASEDAEQLTSQLGTGTTKAPSNSWTLATIRAGFGEVYPETRELFTPQSLNYQLVNAINFRKGCYTGQEIVARLHYKATLKRHMYRVTFTLPDGFYLPAPGAAVVDAHGKTLGELVVAAVDEGNTAEALVVVPDNQLEHLFLASHPEIQLTQLDLPYLIPLEND